MPDPASRPVSETRMVLIVAAVQFVNVLDFIMVMPMGPDFASGLGIPMSAIGIVGGSYTLAAAAAGVVGSVFLDRFDRRWALACAMAGLVVATAAAGLATGLSSLVAARLAAGLFGGPATSIAVAALSDSVVPARRGRAMGTVMMAFSVASVLGVPVGLELSRLFGWRTPFFCVAALGVVVTTAAIFMMPSMRGHLDADGPPSRRNPLRDPLARWSLAITFVTTLGVFSVVPNIAAFVQFNRGYPREYLGTLYLVGGIFSFFSMRLAGAWVDRFGATRIVMAGTLVHAFALYVGFIQPELGVPVLVFFVAYMLSGSLRMVPNGSLSTRVPHPKERASFTSAQSAIQHTGSALGAMASSALLLAEPDGRLLRMEWVAGGALCVSLVVPLLTRRVEAGVKQRERERLHTPQPIPIPASPEA